MRVELIEEYCRQELGEISLNLLPFHNIRHTESVVSNVMGICKNSFFNEEETEIVVIAAWFHDIGYAIIEKGHESISIIKAKSFLTEQNYNIEKIDVIANCIQATQIPQRAQEGRFHLPHAPRSE